MPLRRALPLALLAALGCSDPAPPEPAPPAASSAAEPAPPIVAELPRLTLTAPSLVASARADALASTGSPFELVTHGAWRDASLHVLDNALILADKRPLGVIRGDRYEDLDDLASGLSRGYTFGEGLDIGGRWPDRAWLASTQYEVGAFRWEGSAWTARDDMLLPRSAIGGFTVAGDRLYVVRRSLDKRGRTTGLAAFDVYDEGGKKIDHRRSVFAVGPGCFGGKYHMDLGVLPDGEVLLLGDRCDGPRGGGAPALQRWKPGAAEGVIEPLPLRAGGVAYHHPRASVLVARAPGDLHVLGWVEDDAPHPCAWHHDGTSWSLEVSTERGKLLWGNVTKDGTIWGAFGPAWWHNDSETSVVWRRRPGKAWERVPLPDKRSKTYGNGLELKAFAVTPEGSVWALARLQWDDFYLMRIPAARSGDAL